MDEKKCRKCLVTKKICDFYKHKEMFDGHLNICKTCIKDRVSLHRIKNIDKIRVYDRERGKLPHRVQKTIETTRSQRTKIKGRTAAHNALIRAVKRGQIDKPLICSWCSKTHPQIEGHHPDYSIKLFVVWLCSPCHKILHLGKSKKADTMRKIIKIPTIQQEVR